MSSCVESFGNAVEGCISSAFRSLGMTVGKRPRWTIVGAIVLVILCGAGFTSWETENREDELWVPQDTQAEKDTDTYESLFPPTSRFNNLILSSPTTTVNGNVLTKEALQSAMAMTNEIITTVSTYEDINRTFLDLCARAGGACVTPNPENGVCECLITSVLKQWNYDPDILAADNDVLRTIQSYGSRADLESVLGNPVFDDNDQIVSAQALTISMFLEDRNVVVDGTKEDPINEAWEEDAFLSVAERQAAQSDKVMEVHYFAGRSFSDEFGDAIGGDILLVNVSYIAAFLFLGANMGKIRCGQGSRWTLAWGALATVGLSTAAGFGVSSLFGLFFGPVHSLLPFILLGIGVDDAFVIVNAFNRERKGPRTAESNHDLVQRAGRSLARAGASITVTSTTDLVAFAISSTSAIPALSSFCAACMVLDERRQRDNRRECLCCLTRKNTMEEEDGDVYEEDLVSRYFRNYHAPAILSVTGKAVVVLFFSGLLGFGIFGAMNLSVENSTRNFVPDGYLSDYLEAADEYFPSEGIDVYFVFEGEVSAIFASRNELATLDERLAGKSTVPPYLAEPVSEEAYRNVMTGLYDYLQENGSIEIGGVALDNEGWPTSSEDLAITLFNYTSFSSPGAVYSRDLSLSADGSIQGYQVKSEYVRLTKTVRGEVIDDADRQIEAMDATREMVASWTDIVPLVFAYSDAFIDIEGFKIIKQELFLNVGLALAAVGVIVLVTVASPVTAALITFAVGSCIVEILGMMWALGIVIDSVSVINITLAVGLSVDYSAHVGHCFMTKACSDKNARVTESLADIGAAVLNGAMSTFLAVAVLLGSSSYVFEVLSRQFALTIGFGVLHGLVLLPVLLSLMGPTPYTTAQRDVSVDGIVGIDKGMATTGHGDDEDSG